MNKAQTRSTHTQTTWKIFSTTVATLQHVPRVEAVMDMSVKNKSINQGKNNKQQISEEP